MRKILILANNDIGLYKFRKELIEKLLLEYEVYISLPYGEFVKELIVMGCKFIDTTIDRRGTNPITDLRLMISYRSIIKEIKPDIVLTYTIKPNIYGGLICRLMSIPCLANITGLGTAVENGGFLQKLTLFLYKISLKKAFCVFFQNNENAEYFLNKKIIRGNYKLIPGSGVNLNFYNVFEYPSEETIVFLFVSRVMKQKGIDQFLDAACYFKSKYSNVEFHIVGFCEEDYEDKLDKMQREGIINYHGMQNDVRVFYKISHCIIHPSYYPEGMSNVLLESAACGRPIITTYRSGCREIVDDGINGYLIEPKNSYDLIEKMEKFILLPFDEKRKMGLAGRKKVENQFDRRIVVENYIKEIRKI